MSFSELFIHRPVATILLSIGLFLTGVVAFLSLPVAPLPKVDFPTVMVSAKLPGADPETMAATVAAPLERRLGQIPGVAELTSTSSQGSTNIVVQFELSRNINGAAHDVQAAINAAGSDLPDMPTPPTYRKVNPADSPILILAVTSDTLSPSALYDASDSILNQRISNIEGVAQVTLGGADRPAVRVQVDPVALAATGLGLDDVRNTIAKTNANQPKGTFEGKQQSVIIDVNDQIRKAKDYATLVLKDGGNGNVLRLSDVARVTDSTENKRQAAWFNNTKAVIMIIQKQADANVIDTVDRIKAIMPQLETWMPAGTKISVLADRTQTIRASVHDVEIALLASIFLVIMVTYFSLGRITPTLAVSITVPLSLAGTFAIMWLLGYSIDNISLLALTISVGFVVDDAIVMIENITRHVEAGDSPLEAAVKGAREITFTVISISISLIAVFIPLLFMGGIIGRLFREFAVTLSVAVAVSVVISIVVTPTIYAHLMQWRHRSETGPIVHEDHLGERMFRTMQGWYETGLEWVLRHQRFTLFVMLLTVVFTIWLYSIAPKGFFPQQDTGMVFATGEGRIDISYQALLEKQQQATKIIMADPAVAAMASSIGTGGGPGGNSSNQGRMYIALKPLKDRDVSADGFINRIRPKLAKIEGMSVFMQAAQDIRAGGRTGKAQFQFALWDESLAELREWTPKLVERLKKEPGITDVSSDQDTAAPQVNIVVDRDKASKLGVDMQSIDSVLGSAFAQRQISIIYTPYNQYRVVMEISPRYLEGPSGLEAIYLKAADGKAIRLSTIAHIEMGTAPLSVMHQGQYPASTISFNLPPGAALGDAAKHIEQARKEIGMPPSVQSGFAGNAKAFADSLNDQPILIATAFLSVYIVLGMLYESLKHPITIISTLPSAGLGALLALIVCGYELSIIGIIGVILLMGIVKKNGILLVDFALEGERVRGLSPEAAIIEACKKRFRPIMMTTFAAVLGAVPLIITGGNGAELRQPLGVAIVGGLLVSQILTLYTTPVVYLALEKRRNKRRALKEKLA